MGAKIGVVKEKVKNEQRVAATPHTVKALVQLGCTVFVESGAGEAAFFSDDLYKNAGAIIEPEREILFQNSDIILAIHPPESGKGSSIDVLKKHSIWISYLMLHADVPLVKKLVKKQITFFSMNFVPRISRAQKMDALSSQSNLAGYKAVIIAACEIGKIFPLMMTAAGTIQPSRVVVLGAGVAGLQAIATARRLGAVVEASDVRPAVKEQVESLGAVFIEVPFDKNAEDKTGYAKEVSKEYLQKQSEEIAKRLKNADVVITTAMVPGKKAPVLVTEEMIKTMRQGSVIVDIAVEQGGNCELTEKGKKIIRHGVTILGFENIPSTVQIHASEMYAKNILSFVIGLIKDGNIAINVEDEIYKESLIVHQGEIFHGQTKKVIEDK